MARTVTRGTVKLRAQQLADVVGNPNIPDGELNMLFDVHLAAFWDLLASTGSQADYAFTRTQLTTVGGQNVYPLSSFAPDMLSFLNVFTIEQANIRRPIFPFTDKQRGMYREPQAAYTVEVEYIPCAPQLTDDSQTLDSIDGWDIYVSALMARDIMVHRKQDPSLAAGIAAQTEERIRRMASKRLRGGPHYLEDVEATGMFFPPTVRLNGFRLRGGNLELYELVAIGWP